jgi:sugar/nucleoside kinase (ribokinase family)
MIGSSPTAPPPRAGLLAAGNFIIDHVKMIDYYPAEEMLATILSQSSSNGGGPYNVLKDLAKLGAKFPLYAAGLIGTDDGARWILEDCAQHGINTSGLRQTSAHATSYTDAFTVQPTGRRTFFHQPGANAHLEAEHISLAPTTGRVFYLAYLMLLDALDALDSHGKTGAAKLLQAASAAGWITIADVVSKQHPDFTKATRAALPHLDYLVLNEVESGRLVGSELRPGGDWDRAATITAAETLLQWGVRKWVVIHAVEGAVAVSKTGEISSQPSVNLPAGFSQGATGAGDAFAAGLIYGIHENWPMTESLRAAVNVAACSLRHPSTSQGILSLQECLQLGDTFGYR